MKQNKETAEFDDLIKEIDNSIVPLCGKIAEIMILYAVFPEWKALIKQQWAIFNLERKNENKNSITFDVYIKHIIKNDIQVINESDVQNIAARVNEKFSRIDFQFNLGLLLSPKNFTDFMQMMGNKQLVFDSKHCSTSTDLFLPRRYAESSDRVFDVSSSECDKIKYNHFAILPSIMKDFLSAMKKMTEFTQTYPSMTFKGEVDALDRFIDNTSNIIEIDTHAGISEIFLHIQAFCCSLIREARIFYNLYKLLLFLKKLSIGADDDNDENDESYLFICIWFSCDLYNSIQKFSSEMFNLRDSLALICENYQNISPEILGYLHSVSIWCADITYSGNEMFFVTGFKNIFLEFDQFLSISREFATRKSHDFIFSVPAVDEQIKNQFLQEWNSFVTSQRKSENENFPRCEHNCYEDCYFDCREIFSIYSDETNKWLQSSCAFVKKGFQLFHNRPSYLFEKSKDLAFSICYDTMRENFFRTKMQLDYFSNRKLKEWRSLLENNAPSGSITSSSDSLLLLVEIFLQIRNERFFFYQIARRINTGCSTVMKLWQQKTTDAPDTCDVDDFMQYLVVYIQKNCFSDSSSSSPIGDETHEKLCTYLQILMLRGDLNDCFKEYADIFHQFRNQIRSFKPKNFIISKLMGEDIYNTDAF